MKVQSRKGLGDAVLVVVVVEMLGVVVVVLVLGKAGKQCMDDQSIPNCEC